MEKKNMKDYITKDNICTLLLILILASCLLTFVTAPDYAEKKVDINGDLSVMVENRSTISEIDGGKEFLHENFEYDLKVLYINPADTYFSNLINNLDLNENNYKVVEFNDTHKMIYMTDAYPISYNWAETFSDNIEAYDFRVIVPNGSYNENDRTISENTNALVIVGAEQDYTDHVVESIRGK